MKQQFVLKSVMITQISWHTLFYGNIITAISTMAYSLKGGGSLAIHAWHSQVLCNASEHNRYTLKYEMFVEDPCLFLRWETVEQMFRSKVTHGFLMVLHLLLSRQVWLGLLPFFHLLFITTRCYRIWENSCIAPNRRFTDTRQ